MFSLRRCGLCSPPTQTATVAFSFRWHRSKAFACRPSCYRVPRIRSILHDTVVTLSILCRHGTVSWPTRAPRGRTWATAAAFVAIEAAEKLSVDAVDVAATPNHGTQ